MHASLLLLALLLPPAVAFLSPLSLSPLSPLFSTPDSDPYNARRPRPPYIPGFIADPNYVRIFDTTLRDGEQSPGATLTS